MYQGNYRGNRVVRQTEVEVQEPRPAYVEPVQPVYVEPVRPVVEPAYDNYQEQSVMGDEVVDTSHKAYYDANGNLVEQREELYEDRYQRRVNVLDRVASVMYFFTGALMILLALRFVFRVAGADPNNGIVNFIYNLSSPFVIAFNGILNDQAIGRGGSVFEFSSLIAIALYALVCWGLVQLMYTLFEPRRSSRREFVTSRRRRL